MTYIAYLDEFGHVGPYVARDEPRHNDSPVFGLAGFIMPVEQVRGFGTWFFQLECHRYQTLQAADWIAGLVGRLGAIWKEPEAQQENVVFRRYFERRLTVNQVRSRVRD